MEAKNDQLKKDEELVAAGKNDPANGQMAYDAAEGDIATDPDMNLDPEEGDDLDEGELARLEGEE